MNANIHSCQMIDQSIDYSKENDEHHEWDILLDNFDDYSDSYSSSQDISNPEKSPGNSSSNSPYQGSQEFIQALLRYPTISPARLALILNFKANSIKEEPKVNFKKKKRIRKPVPDEIRQQRNERRRYRYRYRLVTWQFHQQFLPMVTNVFNANDLSLFKSFLDTYYHPNFVYTKILKNSFYNSKKYSSYGLDNYYKILELVLHTSPDMIYLMTDQTVKYNPRTKQTVLIAKNKQCCTRTKVVTSLLSILTESLMSNFQYSAKNSLSNQKNQTFNQNINFIEDYPVINLDNDLEIFDESLFNPYSQDIQIFDTNHINQMMNPFLNQLSTSNTLISFQISQLFRHIDIFSLFQQLIYQPKDTFVSILSWFPSGIKIDVDFTTLYYINENQKIVQLEVFVESIKVELSRGDYYSS